MREVDPIAGTLRLTPLQSVGPLLPSCPDVVYEYTIPLLGTRALHLLQKGDSAPQVYTGPQDAMRQLPSLEERYLVPYEAAKAVSSVYSRCIEPVRFHVKNGTMPCRQSLFDAFARALLTSRVLPSVQIVADNIYALRELDDYQEDVGTNVVRWMEYLAFEALESEVLRAEGAADPDVMRLRSSLRVIRDATSVLDRYRALMRA